MLQILPYLKGTELKMVSMKENKPKGNTVWNVPGL